jgi:hypothetical protein
MTTKVRINFYLEEYLKDDLIKLAKSDGRSMSTYIEWIVKESIKKGKKQGVV